MQLGMIGLGRMGAAMAGRLLGNGHACLVFDRDPEAGQRLQDQGASRAATVAGLVAGLTLPRVVWLMLPSAAIDEALEQLMPLLAGGDIVVDGGNSHFQDDIRRGRLLNSRGIRFLDVGTSGGIAGAGRGYCLMVGGEASTFEYLRPILASLAPGVGAASRQAGRGPEPDQAEQGFLLCGPQGAGHFVKMVHNGIEYGLMAAYAEGFSVLRGANAGDRPAGVDAETTPLAHPEFYRFQFDLAAISELWRRGSVVSSWLLDLTADALHSDQELLRYRGHVADSGEGRWTLMAAIDEAIPVPVLSAAVFDRFASRGNATYAHRVLSAMRGEFGGHPESTED